MARTKAFDEEEVLDKAVTLFWDKGYTITSANDLVKELGLSRSSLYDTYGDKRRLFIAALNRYSDRVVGKMITIINESKDIKTTLEALFTHLLKQDLNSRIPKGCMMANSAVELATLDDDIKVLVQRNQENVEGAFEKAILKGQERGEVSRRHLAKSLAKFLFNNITGLHVSAKYTSNVEDNQAIVDVIVSVLED